MRSTIEINDPMTEICLAKVEGLSHFFPPHFTPLLNSFSINGKSCSCGQREGCCSTYRTRARTTAEVEILQPVKSDASWPRSWSVLSSAGVSVNDRTTSDSFFLPCFARAMKQVINLVQRGTL